MMMNGRDEDCGSLLFFTVADRREDERERGEREKKREKEKERKMSDPSSCSSRDEKLGKKMREDEQGKEEKDEDERKNDVSSRNKMFDERKGSDE